jgi:Leucine-rich repeat (LRR) protein
LIFLLGAVAALELECRFYFNDEINYKTCLLVNVSLENQVEDLNFSGTPEQRLVSFLIFFKFIVQVNDFSNLREWIELVQVRQSNTSVIPNQIFEAFKNIIILEMMNISLREIDHNSFTNAKTLRRFWARDNLIEHIPDNTFIEASNMTHIGLQNNLIETIEEEAFAGLNNLKVLKLEFNKIKSLPDDVFAPLPNLDHLHMRDNQLSRINDKLFRKNPALVFINLQNNDIGQIGRHAFENAYKLDRLILLNNACLDRDFADIKNWQLRRLKVELHKCFKHWQ